MGLRSRARRVCSERREELLFAVSSERSLAETSGYFGEPLIFAELQFARGRQLLTFLNLNPIFALLNGRPATAYRSSKYLLTVCARQDFPNE